MRQVVDEERRFFIAKSLITSRGKRPRALRGAARGDKRTGEADRVLPASRKSAEPVETGRADTSASVSGPVREPAMERGTEPMAEAPSQHQSRQRGSGRDGRKAGGESDRTKGIRTEGVQPTARQPLEKPARSGCRIPHGVESAPKVGKRVSTEPENLVVASSSRRVKMIEATDDRENEGRSLRSSPRTGKPSTWRRKAVGTDCQQEVGQCPAR